MEPSFLPSDEINDFNAYVRIRIVTSLKVTMELEKETLDFFRQKAQSLGASYQRMIRKLLSEYVAQHNRDDHNLNA